MRDFADGGGGDGAGAGAATGGVRGRGGVLPVASVANVGLVRGSWGMRPVEVGCSKAASALPQGRGRPCHSFEFMAV